MTPKGWEGGRALRQGQALASGRFSRPERRWEQGHAAESCRKAPPRGNGTFGERGTKQRHLSGTSHPTQLLQGGQSYQIPARFGEAHPDHFLTVPNTWMGPKGSVRAAWCWCPPPQAPSQEQTQRLSLRNKIHRGWGSAARLQLLPWPHAGPPRAGPSPPSPANCSATGFWHHRTPMCIQLCPSAERTGRCSGVPARAHRGDVLGENPAPEVQLTLQKDPQVE